jgi:hypothetical protein
MYTSGVSCEPAAPFVPIPSSISITPDSRAITALRYTEQFTARAIDQRGAVMTNTHFQWSTSNSNVVTVTDSGFVTAVGPGVAIIRAEFGGALGTSEVNVTQLPAQLYLFAGNGQEGRARERLPLAVVVRVLDEAGSPVAGVTVAFAPGDGGSVTNTTSVANQLGEASTQWTLGSVAGQQFLLASVGSAVTATFTANALPAVPPRPQTLTKLTADAACVWVGDTLKPAPAVLVRDQYGDPLPGAPVWFSYGNTATQPGEHLTNAAGIALADPFVVPAAGEHSILASVATGSGEISVQFRAQGFALTGPREMIRAAPDGSPWPAVLVKDAFGNPVAGVIVTFANTLGPGYVIGPLQATDASGIATVGQWVAGASGEYALTATAAGTPCGVQGNPVTFTRHVP